MRTEEGEWPRTQPARDILWRYFTAIAFWSSGLKGREALGEAALNVVVWICMSGSRHPKGSYNHQDERKRRYE